MAVINEFSGYTNDAKVTPPESRSEGNGHRGNLWIYNRRRNFIYRNDGR